jgi:hypothetical protein
MSFFEDLRKIVFGFILTLLIVFSFLFFTKQTYASVFPNDAISVDYTAGSGTTGTIWTVPANHIWTILYVNLISNSNSASVSYNGTTQYLVYCYPVPSATSYNCQNDSFFSKDLVAGDTVRWNKSTTGAYAMIEMTYVDRDLSATSVSEDTLASINSNIGVGNTYLASINSNIGVGATDPTLVKIDDKLNSIGFYVFMMIVLSIVYLIARWVYNLISTTALGW